MVRETYSEQETFELGKEIGEHAKGGEVFYAGGRSWCGEKLSLPRDSHTGLGFGMMS